MSRQPPSTRTAARVVLPAMMLLAASGCCRWNDDPLWTVFGPLYVGDDEVQVDLSEYVVDDGGKLIFDASSQDEGLIAWAEIPGDHTQP